MAINLKVLRLLLPLAVLRAVALLALGLEQPLEGVEINLAQAVKRDDGATSPLQRVARRRAPTLRIR